MRARRPILREAEQRELVLGERRVAYTLKRSSARRTLALKVGEDGEVTVNAPMRMAWHRIEAFLNQHADWLRQRLENLRRQTFRWQDGIELPYLGSLRRLSMEPAALPLVFPLADRILVGGGEDGAAVLVTDWYRSEAARLLPERLFAHVARVGYPMPRFRLTGASSRWGSLSPTGVLSLNWRLLKASEAEIDYVICHELAHMRVPNHSSRFWREVEALYPGFEEPKARLRQNAALYFQF
ncbi:MAG: M48 family metallopeptidase [Betaproteobacteria bacterium]|nr:M48 family metallopeptidase [Betaproteobacteria bacterium]